MAKSPTQRVLDRREQYRMTICGQDRQRKRRTEQLSLGDGKVMESKLIKHDAVMRELKEFRSAGKCASKPLLRAIKRAVM